MTEILDQKAIISRICHLREKYAGKRGKTLFAKALGISPSTYNYYEQDRLPPIGVFWDICRLTGADIRWLITGSSEESADPAINNLPESLQKKITALLHSEPKNAFVLEAFIELLQNKTDFEEHLSDTPASPPLNKPSWLPILGRTAAGIVHFWQKNDAQLPNLTELAQLIQKHQKSRHRQMSPGDVSTDLSLPSIPHLDVSSVVLVRLNEVGDDGVCEFIECPEIIAKFPDAFALRVDGNSMAPRIQDADIVVLSPSATARDGVTAVVKLCDQIGVTCKIIRHSGEQIHLIAANEKFDTKVYNLNQVLWSLAVLWRIRLP